MDLIEMAKEIGRGLQQNELYTRATADAEAVNASPELGAKVKEFEALRVKLEAAVAKCTPGTEDQEVMDLDEKLHALYDEITSSPLMMAYNASREEFEHFVNHITKIITGSANGQNPDEITLDECTGSCESCGGCH